MDLMICIILTIAMVVSYFLLRYLLNCRLDKNLINIIWCIMFIIYGFFSQRTEFRLISVKDTGFITFGILAIALQFIYVYYFKYQRSDEKYTDLYYIFIKPITLEMVFGGILLPTLYTLKFLNHWVSIGILYFNGVIFIVAILQIILALFDKSMVGGIIGQVFLNLIICLFHGLIITGTKSIIIPILLRVLYALLFFRFSIKIIRLNSSDGYYGKY